MSYVLPTIIFDMFKTVMPNDSTPPPLKKGGGPIL